WRARRLVAKVCVPSAPTAFFFFLPFLAIALHTTCTKACYSRKERTAYSVSVLEWGLLFAHVGSQSYRCSNSSSQNRGDANERPPYPYIGGLNRSEQLRLIQGS